MTPTIADLDALRQAGGVFVSGTDTDVGKTVVAAALVRALAGDYWKPVQAGLEGGGDAREVARLAELPPDRIHASTYTLSRPRSPHEAARADGIDIRLAAFQPPRTPRPLIVEGAGGLLVPLNDREFVADLARELGLPVVVVARSGLGTLNHTLLTLEALQARELPLAGIVMCGPRDAENRSSLAAFTAAPWIVEFPTRAPLGPDTCAEFAQRLTGTLAEARG